jgi:FixJ family two-component response regulator
LPARTETLQQAPVVSIVDDDESVRTAAKCLVRSLGCDAHIFASAEEFLKSALVSTSACLIVDVQMPKMNGLELQSALRAKGHHTPIIFITAFPEERFRARAFEEGAICFLSKPFDAKDLVDCLTMALASARGGGSESAS